MTKLLPSCKHCGCTLTHGGLWKTLGQTQAGPFCSACHSYLFPGAKPEFPPNKLIAEVGEKKDWLWLRCLIVGFLLGAGAVLLILGLIQSF